MALYTLFKNGHFVYGAVWTIPAPGINMYIYERGAEGGVGLPNSHFISHSPLLYTPFMCKQAGKDTHHKI